MSRFSLIYSSIFQASKNGIRLYGSAQSTCTQRVLTTLTEKGLKFELIPIDLMKGEHKVRKMWRETHSHSILGFLVGSEIHRRDATIWCYSCARRRKWFQNIRFVTMMPISK